MAEITALVHGSATFDAEALWDLGRSFVLPPGARSQPVGGGDGGGGGGGDGGGDGGGGGGGDGGGDGRTDGDWAAGCDSGSSFAQQLESFRQHVLSWPPARLRQLLEFCTALKVLPQPAHARSLRKQPVTVHFAPPTAPGELPTASTCTRELYVPLHPTAELVRKRFEQALDHTAAGSGFFYQ